MTSIIAGLVFWTCSAIAVTFSEPNFWASLTPSFRSSPVMEVFLITALLRIVSTPWNFSAALAVACSTKFGFASWSFLLALAASVRPAPTTSPASLAPPSRAPPKASDVTAPATSLPDSACAAPPTASSVATAPAFAAWVAAWPSCATLVAFSTPETTAPANLSPPASSATRTRPERFASATVRRSSKAFCILGSDWVSMTSFCGTPKPNMFAAVPASILPNSAASSTRPLLFASGVPRNADQPSRFETGTLCFLAMAVNSDGRTRISSALPVIIPRCASLIACSSSAFLSSGVTRVASSF